MGVRRPSVKPVFSEPVRQINATFGGKLPFYHIFRPVFLFVFQNFAVLFLYDFLALLDCVSRANAVARPSVVRRA